MTSETKEDRLVDEHIAEVIARVEEEDQQPHNEAKEGKDSTFLWLVIGIIIVFLGILTWSVLYKQAPAKTLQELHQLNLQGKLPPEQGYIANGFSFIKYNDFWYTQLKGKNSQLEVYMRYGPHDVKDVTVVGNLSPSFYHNNKSMYITFDPDESDLKYHAVAVSDLSRALYGAFGVVPVAACTHENPDCEGRPLINCENATSPTLFITNKEPTLLALKNNCIQIQGKGFEVIRAADRLLLSWYGVI